MDREQLLLYSIFVIISLFMTLTRYLLVGRKNKMLRENIFAKKLLHFSEFEANWIVHTHGKKGVSGYKYNDTSGCYVILVYDDYMTEETERAYEAVYVGQSVKICQRVHNHFNGKGNGDVYADIKYGKQVYVQFVPTPEHKMNQVEKELIQAFNATNSYNATRGGAMAR